MSTEKKQYKCGTCGEIGHNKKTCPTLKTEHTPAPTNVVADVEEKKIRVITVAEQVPSGRVDTMTYLCASVDAVERKLTNILKKYNENYADPSLPPYESDDPVIRKHYKNLAFYTPEEDFKELVCPTRAQIEAAMNGRLLQDNVLIKLSEPGSAMNFALEISVSYLPVYE